MREVKLSAVDLNLLVALDALLDESSVSGAARRLHRSQPAVSRMLARLRDTFGDALLVQEGRAMVATPRGRALREPVKLVLRELQGVLRPPPPFDAATATRHFRIATSDYAQVVLLGPVLDELARTAPGVSLELHTPGPGLAAALASGEVELVLGPPTLAPPWCEQRPFVADAWACVRRADAPLPRSLAAYVALPHLQVATELAFGGPIDAALARLGHARRSALTVPDFAGALFAAAQSLLVATVPRPVALRGAELLPLRTAPLPFEARCPPVAMIWPRRLTTEPGHAWLRAAVEASLTRLPEGRGTERPRR